MSIDTGDQLQLTQFAAQDDEESKHGNTIGEQELINDLRAGYIALGRAPTTMEMDAFGEHGAKTYFRRFGSWIGALEAAGIPVPDERRKENG